LFRITPCFEHHASKISKEEEEQEEEVEEEGGEPEDADDVW
jgi:hypothetical protein